MLSPKRQRFVEEYLVDLNATQAAIRAKYSARDAHNQGARLLANVGIKAEIERVLAERSAANQAIQKRVLEELARVAFADTTKIVKFENGRMVITETADLSEDERRVISEMSESVSAKGGRTRKVKCHDKMKALELIGRHLKMFADRQVLEDPDGKAVVPVMIYLPDNKRDADDASNG